MKVLVENARTELIVKNSRFINEAIIVRDQAEARNAIHEQKLKYSDATHVVHAFVVGKNAETCGMSDDGEPSGTAGRPMLDVLKGSGITNILITVTRYFGGTLLGTGGLVHAYGDSCKQVLAVCKTEELVDKMHFEFSTDYSTYQDAARLLEAFHISNKQEDFGAEVLVKGHIYADETETLGLQIKNLTKGKTEVKYTCI